jgi:Anti-sigma-K factor rskA
MSPEDLERHLERLPREAWDRPAPPPPPWPAEEPSGARRRRGLFLRPLAAGAAALVLLGAGIGAGLLLSGGEDDAPGGPETEPLRVELDPVGGRGRGAAGTARLEPRPGGRATVELAGLRPSGDRDFYELWLLGDDGELVSLGSVRVPDSGRAELDVELPVDPARFRYLDVSREPADGDPSHSTISVLRGQTPS